MPTVKNQCNATIKYINKDTAIYVLEKVQEAVEETLNDRTKNVYNENGDLVGTTTKNYLEMFQTLGEKIQNILNKIKREDE